MRTISQADRNFQRYLRSEDRAQVEQLLHFRMSRAQTTHWRKSEEGRARDRHEAELCRAELARRERQAAEARAVAEKIRGEASHAALRDLLLSALELECDQAIDAALGIWKRAEAGYGPLPWLFPQVIETTMGRIVIPPPLRADERARLEAVRARLDTERRNLRMPSEEEEDE